MKMMLSMPRTISRIVSVTSAMTASPENSDVMPGAVPGACVVAAARVSVKR